MEVAYGKLRRTSARKEGVSLMLLSKKSLVMLKSSCSVFILHLSILIDAS